MQWAGTSRALVKWGLGGILLAAAALALLLCAGGDRAGAAELPAPTPGLDRPLPEPVGGVVGGLEATGEQVVGAFPDPVFDDAGAVVVPGVGTVDPGTLPVVGALLDPGIVPLPVQVLPTIPDLPGLPTIPDLPGVPTIPEPPGPAPLRVTPADAAPGGPGARAAPPGLTTSGTRDPWTASDTGDGTATGALPAREPGDDGPAVPAPAPVDPLGTVAAAVGGAGAPGLIVVAVLAAFAWAAGRGPGRRLSERAAVALGGPPIAFERPG